MRTHQPNYAPQGCEWVVKIRISILRLMIIWKENNTPARVQWNDLVFHADKIPPQTKDVLMSYYGNPDIKRLATFFFHLPQEDWNGVTKNSWLIGQINIMWQVLKIMYFWIVSQLLIVGKLPEGIKRNDAVLYHFLSDSILVEQWTKHSLKDFFQTV